MMDVGSILRMHGVPPEQLAQMQAVTSRIKASIHSEDGKITIQLDANDPEAAQYLPHVMEGLVSSVAQSLYQLFGIQGKRF